MIYDILQMQSGGVAIPPFSYYKPVMVNTSSPSTTKSVSTSSSSSSGKSGNELGDKDLMKMLQSIDGLPSDMRSIYNQLQRFYDAQSLGINTSDLSRQYLSAMQALKVAKFQKQEYDNAYKTVQDRKGLNEIAIVGNNQVAAFDLKENKITYVNVDTYLKNKDKYQACTNADLLNYRAETKANDSSILKVVNNGIGLEYIDNLIKQYMEKLGSDETSSSQYIQKSSTGKLDALNDVIAKAYNGSDEPSVSYDGLYKIETVNRNQARQAQQAIRYIYEQLPDNAKTLLAAKSNTGNIQDAYQYVLNSVIASKVGMTVSNKTEVNRELIEDSTGKKPGGTKSGSTKDGDDMNTATQWLLGYGNKSDFLIQNTTTDGIRVRGNDLPIVSKEGTPYGVMQSLQNVSQSQFAGILDWTSASIGGEKINPEMMNQILSTEGTIHSIDMPIDLEKASQGEIVPDFDAMKRKSAADKKLRDQGILMNSPEEIAKNLDVINKIYQEFNLPVAYGDDGQLLNNGAWRRFGVINAIAYDKAMGDMDFDQNPFLEEIKDEGRIRNITSQIKRVNGWDGKDKSGEFEFDEDNWYDWNGHDHYYKGTVFIPVKKDYFSAQAGSGEKTSPEYALNTETRQQVEEIKDAQFLQQQENKKKKNYVDPSKL